MIGNHFKLCELDITNMMNHVKDRVRVWKQKYNIHKLSKGLHFVGKRIEKVDKNVIANHLKLCEFDIIFRIFEKN